MPPRRPGPAPTATFVVGRAKSGKSTRIAERIVELLRSDPLGPPVLLVVPKQATLEHERHFALNCGLPGHARLRVHSFDSLLQGVAADVGGGGTGARVDRLGRLVLLHHLLRRHADGLTYFRSAAKHPGTVAQIDAALLELAAADADPADVADRLEAHAADAGDATPAKARDLARIDADYRRLLGPRIDPQQHGRVALLRAGDSPLFRGATLFVDGFDALSAADRRLLVAAAGACRETVVTFRLDPADDLDLFAAASASRAALAADLSRIGVKSIVNDTLEVAHFESPALSLIERSWPQPNAPVGRGQEAGGVRLLRCPTPAAEAEAAAAQVLDWLADGLRPRDCVVLCRDLEAYRADLEAAFAEVGLPTFADRRRPTRHHPLVALVRGCLRVADGGWRHADAIDLLKCGLLGDADGAHVLENYVLEHRVRGRAAWTQREPWGGRRRGEEDEAPALDEPADVADRVRRRLVDAVAPLSEAIDGPARTAAEHAASLWETIESLGVPASVAALVDAADPAEVDEHRQAWSAVCGLLDQVVDLFGDEPLTGREFARSVEFGLEQVEFAVVPPTLDATILGDVRRTVLPPGGARACVVVGLAEGVFPAAAEPALVLDDADRRALRAGGVEVEPAADERQARERHLAYLAFTRGSERLTLTRPAADAAGRPLAASEFYERVRSLLNLGEEAIEGVAAVASGRAATTLAMRWARDGANPADPAAAVYQHLAARPEPQPAWGALAYANAPGLSPAAAGRLYGDAVGGTVGRIESYVRCPFAHFARHSLGLRVRDERRSTPRDLGMVYHEVLGRLFAREPAATLADRGRVRASLPVLAGEVGGEVRRGLFGEDGRGRYLVGKAARDLTDVTDSQRAVLDLGDFAPAWADVTFGGESAALPAIEFDVGDGRTFSLRGRIDRVDATPDRSAAVVIDYKAARGEVRFDPRRAAFGLSLGLPTLMLALLRHGGRLAGGGPPPQPVAGLLVKVLRPLEKCDDPASHPREGEVLFDLRVKPRGIIDYDFLPKLDAAFANDDPAADRHRTHASDGFAARTKKDGDPYAGCDAARPEEIDAVIAGATAIIERSAAAIFGGDVSVYPYRLGRESPCGQCEYRAACRFEPPADSYRVLRPEGADGG